MGQHTYQEVRIEGNANAVLGDAIYNLIIAHQGESEQRNVQLLEAAEQGDVKRAQNLLEQGASIRYVDAADGQTVLHKAVISRQVELVHQILSNPNVRRFLLNYKDKYWSDTPLHRAAAEGDPEIVKALLEYSPPLEALQGNGGTPLIVAANFGNAEVVSILLKSGANPFATDLEGNTALHIAAKLKHVTTVEAILKADSAEDWLEWRNNWNDTPVFIAVINGSEKCARLLWKFGAKLNTRNVYDETLLHAAVRGNLPNFLADIIPYFSFKQLNYCNSEDETPFQLAIDKGNVRCERVLDRKLPR